MKLSTAFALLNCKSQTTKRTLWQPQHFSQTKRTMRTTPDPPPRPEKPEGTIISFQSIHDEIPDYLVEVKQLFEKISVQRQKYRDECQKHLDEAAELCKTLTPKESFMTRLRLIDSVRIPDRYSGYACQEEENVGNSFKFRLYGRFTISCDERAFVEDDPRYEVIWDDVKCHDKNVFAMNAYLFLDEEEHKRVVEEEQYSDHDDD